jgi:hypothetical protein
VHTLKFGGLFESVFRSAVPSNMVFTYALTSHLGVRKVRGSTPINPHLMKLCLKGTILMYAYVDH